MPETTIQFRTRRPAPPGPQATQGAPSTRLTVRGMDCGNCVRKVTEALQHVGGVAFASVELERGAAFVQWSPNAQPDPNLLIQAVTKAGYAAALATSAATTAESPVNPWKIPLLAGIPVTAILLFADWVLGLATHPTWHWIALVLGSIVQILAGGRFYRGAWNQWKARSANMDTLVSLGSTAAYGYSVWALLTHVSEHLFFTEAATILTLISTGHWLETRLAARAGDALRALLSLTPDTARRLQTDGSRQAEVDVPVSVLQPGDQILLRPGDRIPVDAEVVEGQSHADESMLTGESQPIGKSPGARLHAGTLNQSGRLVARVTGVGESTALARIVATVRRAQSSRTNIQRLADRISAIFVPVVVLVAAASGLFWGLIPGTARHVHQVLAHYLWHVHLPDNPWAAAITMFCAVLIVACPCAMGLATPVALMAGVNAGTRRGILIRDGTAIEKSGTITTVAFDKTGTLTAGQPSVVASRDFSGNDSPPAACSPLHIAGAIAATSRHPLSRAIAAAAAATPGSAIPWNPGTTTERRGSGIEARPSPEGGAPLWRLGSAPWLITAGVDVAPVLAWLHDIGEEDSTVVLLAENSRLVAAFAIRDALRPNAPLVVKQLQDAGLKAALITGDRAEVAWSIAVQVGIPADLTHAQIPSDAKAAVVARMQAGGERVAFVGDGLNDAPALAQADLGIAVGEATDIAREAADIVLLRRDLSGIPDALSLATRTLQVIRQNLFWAFFYNAAAVPLAAMGFISPVVCALTMGLSDLFVIGNAMRLRRWKS